MIESRLSSNLYKFRIRIHFQALCCDGIYGRLGTRIKDVLLPSRRHSRVSIEEPRNEKQGMELNNF